MSKSSARTLQRTRSPRRHSRQRECRFPVDVSVLLRPGWPGRTSILLSPLGRVSAECVSAPVRVELLPAPLRLRGFQDLVLTLEQEKVTLARARADAGRNPARTRV